MISGHRRHSELDLRLALALAAAYSTTSFVLGAPKTHLKLVETLKVQFVEESHLPHMDFQ